ncbi:ABC transporter ATP-binding protein [Ethanoligenens harbinense]|uniref:ABC transporter transmembrane region n=1 Tax=Ethanoligenens harbinense (strain DSM 18485 / JCM 12961 / CGMCC 1.5033 / YUAN-3) TaxID=663278 RepID=E6U8L2_ETHHY|nr:ABC transporter ATP-binding protein [Ethanoligenens harbinense]ADU26003.1 ABC transporter transmembrane region [Ethanoligenens harbinense YUAN-3]AVQ95150.1 ABC transporter ATP-binding protein [Ethanoligenens harbinense YUAN-3]AYF37840.1 ABC transporter ATP-binding protein [Ethanoligenens harbinense]AYF40563.1 ABC transporter ATP-binding protein [Ethanoligenens harbinense]QCN91396.1 ABC transporter ATP-binding protein [Ethanoligenens harbinense]
MSEQKKTAGPMNHGGPGGSLGRPVEKAKDFGGTLKRLLGYLRPQRMRLTVVVIFAVLGTVFMVVGPKISGQAINKLTDGFIAKSAVNNVSKIQTQAAPNIKKLLDGMSAAKAQAKAAADAKVEAQFGQAGADVTNSAALAASARATAEAQAMQTAQAAVLKQANLTQAQFDAMQAFYNLPNVKTIKSANEKADTVQKIFDLSKQMPQSSGNKASIKESDLKTALADIRETGGAVPFGDIFRIIVLMLAVYALSAIFTFVMQYLMSTVAQKTVYDMRRDVDLKLAKLPLKYFDGHSNGEILSRVTNDVDTISTTLQQSLTQLIQSVLQLVGFIIMMLTISPALTGITLATLPLYIFATAMIAKQSQKHFARQQKYLGQLSGHTEEMFTGHKIVKAFGHEDEAIDIFEDSNEKLYAAGWKAQFLSGIMFPTMNFISNIGYVLVSVFGGLFVTKNWLNVGDIVAFIQYSRQFTMPIIQTANITNIIQSTIACAERVFEVLDEDEETPEPANPPVLENPLGNVVFEHVKFSYKDTEPLMEDMNLHVKKGDTIAIVGPTGAGKTTLVNLLMRFYEIKGGKITFDGVDTREMRRGDLRTLFGMVLQDTWLFTGTIEANIAYGREGATHEDVVRAAEAAHADHFIRSLPDGYNTVLNEEATNISQGQKQLLTIARAILADPAVLILDEATSSVDTRTEVLIQHAMAKLMEGRTNFVIAHRLSTIRDAKMILVMNHGSVIEQGNHEELLAKGGFYADLYNAQFSGASIDEAG